ncbi:MAG TPA: ABC transporter ATP-binding protein [Thermoanaerobaculia bacterium]|nr:ABC transporter ATP-binding protein [Thermoanaerobaculia bacterium]
MTVIPVPEIRRPAARPGKETLLEIRDLRTSFRTDEGLVHAVDKVSFTVGRGEAVALVGESGSGKSVTAFSIMGLVQSPGRITHGEIRFKDRNLVGIKEDDYRKIRGNDIAMIFQEPMTSLNPVFTIGDQVMEAIRIHRHVGKKEARKQAIEALELVAIPDPHKRIDDYPHQLSGGMRQRIMIAIALSCDPELLIADEPTTALDVTIQAQIMELMGRLQQQLGLAILLITHDLGVVAEFCERIIVMYTGRIVEEAPVRHLFGSPGHPYTRGLLRSLPKLDQAGRGERRRLESIPGMVPSITDLPKGCKFNTRCPDVMEICYGLEPARMMIGQDHDARCYLHGELAEPDLEEMR